jgi:hypothetical protein
VFLTCVRASDLRCHVQLFVDTHGHMHIWSCTVSCPWTHIVMHSFSWTWVVIALLPPPRLRFSSYTPQKPQGSCVYIHVCGKPTRSLLVSCHPCVHCCPPPPHTHKCATHGSETTAYFLDSSGQDAVAFGVAAAPFGLEFVEEPVSDPGCISAFCSETGLRVALDETMDEGVGKWLLST